MGIFLTMADTIAGVELAANGNDFGLKLTTVVGSSSGLSCAD